MVLRPLRGPAKPGNEGPRGSGSILRRGLFLPGQARNYIILNLSDKESWRGVAHHFAHVYLNYNSPPTQPWFDEGFAEYFSSLHMDDKQAQIGTDPESFTEILNTQKW